MHSPHLREVDCWVWAAGSRGLRRQVERPECVTTISHGCMSVTSQGRIYSRPEQESRSTVAETAMGWHSHFPKGKLVPIHMTYHTLLSTFRGLCTHFLLLEGTPRLLPTLYQCHHPLGSNCRITFLQRSFPATQFPGVPLFPLLTHILLLPANELFLMTLWHLARSQGVVFPVFTMWPTKQMFGKTVNE